MKNLLILIAQIIISSNLFGQIQLSGAIEGNIICSDEGEAKVFIEGIKGSCQDVQIILGDSILSNGECSFSVKVIPVGEFELMVRNGNGIEETFRVVKVKPQPIAYLQVAGSRIKKDRLSKDEILLLEGVEVVDKCPSMNPVLKSFSLVATNKDGSRFRRFEIYGSVIDKEVVSGLLEFPGLNKLYFMDFIIYRNLNCQMEGSPVRSFVIYVEE